jgi:hypothetical protein
MALYQPGQYFSMQNIDLSINPWRVNLGFCGKNPFLNNTRRRTMSGSKTIKNNSNVAISVILRGRNGSDPHGGSLPPVSSTIAPQKSVTLQYGNDQNPYLNEMSVEGISSGSDIRQSYVATVRGGPGTLDNLFNTNSTLTIAFNSGNYSFALSAQN